jgi:hypothetical protein
MAELVRLERQIMAQVAAVVLAVRVLLGLQRKVVMAV